MADRTEHRWAVDAIEEGIARIEEDGERMITVPVTLLPPGTREGQVLRATRSSGGAKGEPELTVVLDGAGTQTARRASKTVMDAAMAESKKRDPGGDVAL